MVLYVWLSAESDGVRSGVGWDREKDYIALLVFKKVCGRITSLTRQARCTYMYYTCNLSNWAKLLAYQTHQCTVLQHTSWSWWCHLECFSESTHVEQICCKCTCKEMEDSSLNQETLSGNWKFPVRTRLLFKGCLWGMLGLQVYRVTTFL